MTEGDEDKPKNSEVPPKAIENAPEPEQKTEPMPEIQELVPDDNAPPPDSRMRSDSRSATASFMTSQSGAVSSEVFIVTALDAIGASREARKSKELGDSVQVALANVKQEGQQAIDPELIFRPLHMASKTLSVPLQVTALDCIGKLITYSYFAFPSAKSETSPPRSSPLSSSAPSMRSAIASKTRLPRMRSSSRSLNHSWRRC